MHKTLLLAKYSTVLHEQITEPIREQIQSGLYRLCDRLMLVRQLANDQAICVSTTVQAHQQLEDQG